MTPEEELERELKINAEIIFEAESEFYNPIGDPDKTVMAIEQEAFEKLYIRLKRENIRLSMLIDNMWLTFENFSKETKQMYETR